VKKALLSSAAVAVLVLSSLAAFAADLPADAPAMAPIPFYDWTGCYIGGHVGGAFSSHGAATHNSSGFVGGGQIGCDYQFAPRWVVGAEARAAGTNVNESRPSTVTNLVTLVTVPSQFTRSNDFLASATARAGYSLANRWLVFVRGGAAWTREKLDDAFTNARALAVDPSLSRTRTGWTVGTGVDWAFAPHWSATLEYNFYDFGAHGAQLTDSVGTVVTFSSLKDTLHAVTAGVNYHF
jgi:outer membrane immunogenic protein